MPPSHGSPNPTLVEKNLMWPSYMQNATPGKQSRDESEESQPKQNHKKRHFFEDGHEHSMVDAAM